jgi:hypothetical protein
MQFSNLEAVYRFGQYVIASAMFPQFNSPNQIVMVYQIKCDTKITLTQALQYIAFINNRASLWGDGLLAAALATGKVEDIKEEMSGSLKDGDLAWTCTIIKKGQPSPIVRTFDWSDATVAGLVNKDTYKKWPKRMIQMRARAWALRDSGLTGGVGSAEEEEDRQYVESASVRRVPLARPGVAGVAERLTVEVLPPATAPQPKAAEAAPATSAPSDDQPPAPVRETPEIAPSADPDDLERLPFAGNEEPERPAKRKK